MSVAEVRAAEQATMRTVPEPVLMARAADAIAGECDSILTSTRGRVAGSRVVVLVGPGKNGGDGLLAGARLASRGATVVAILTTDAADAAPLQECEEAGATTIEASHHPHEALHAVARAELVIDAIAGIGSTPGLRRPADALVAAIASSATIVSVDVPSGLGADSANADSSHVHADVTVTFTALKACLAGEPARASAGRIVIAQVGIPLPKPL